MIAKYAGKNNAMRISLHYKCEKKVWKNKKQNFYVTTTITIYNHHHQRRWWRLTTRILENSQWHTHPKLTQTSFAWSCCKLSHRCVTFTRSSELPVLYRRTLHKRSRNKRRGVVFETTSEKFTFLTLLIFYFATFLQNGMSVRG